MEVREDEINLIDLWNVVAKRKNLILSLTLVSAVLALVISLQLPKVFEGEAVVALPKGGGLIINASETKAIIDVVLKELKKGNPIDGIDGDLTKKIADIKVDQVKGSDTQFKVTVRIKDEPQKAKDVFNKVLAYLNKNEYVQRRISIEKSAIEANIAETKRTIELAEKTRNEAIRLISIRNPVGFNPVDLDVRIRDLRSAIIGLETSLALMKGYEFVSGPYVYKNKVKPRVAMNTLIAGFFGLFASLLLAFMIESLEKSKEK